MAYDTTPLTARILEAVADHWGIPTGEGLRLHGGEESSAYRLTGHVVRIGPAWRSDEELEWGHAVAAHAARTVPEAIAPIPARGGATVVRVEGRPVSVWPFRAGTWPEDDADFADQAAELLARLHRALTGLRMPPRPGPGPDLAPAPDLADGELDRWLAAPDAAAGGRQPLHGDFYAGNTLVEDGRIVGLLDWDESLVGQPELELAWAAWEWGEGLHTLDIGRALAFVDTYVEAGGVASRIDDVTLSQFVRERIRREVRYARAARLRGVHHDADDHDYEARQLAAFEALRPRRGAAFR